MLINRTLLKVFLPVFFLGIFFLVLFPFLNPIVSQNVEMLTNTTPSSAVEKSLDITTTSSSLINPARTTSVIITKAKSPPVASKPEVPKTVVQPVPPSPTPTAPVITPVASLPKMKIALPLYVYPSPNEKNWQMAIDADDQVDFIIANVHNGPGMEIKINWTDMIQKTVTAGVKVYGYVYTEYGKRDAGLVDTDVALWFKFYPQISGIFFDEVASGADKLPYYKARHQYVKNINSKLQVVINPGTNTDEGYMNVSDVNIVFESGYGSWLTKKMPAWVPKYPKERFYAIIYDVPNEIKMKEAVQVAKERNFGRIFITSASGPSSPLPPYFQAELSEIAK